MSNIPVYLYNITNLGDNIISLDIANANDIGISDIVQSIAYKLTRIDSDFTFSKWIEYVGRYKDINNDISLESINIIDSSPNNNLRSNISSQYFKDNDIPLECINIIELVDNTNDIRTDIRFRIDLKLLDQEVDERLLNTIKMKLKLGW